MKHTIKTIFSVLFILITTRGSAQIFTPKWETCLGGTEWDEATGILFSDSSYWVVANSNSNDGDISFNHGAYDYWFLNVDKNGNLISEKTFGGNYADGGFIDIKAKNDSVFYIAAWSQSVDGDISNNPWPGPAGNLWVLQVNKQGDILWETMAGGSGQDELRDIKVTGDGGVLLLGVTTSEDGDITDYHGGYDLWLINIDSSGQKQWNKCFGGTGIQEGGSVIQTSDGGYMILGSTDGRGGGNYDSACNHHGTAGIHSDTWIVKLDSNRVIEWQQCYGGTYEESGTNLIELTDGYIILGFTQSNDGDVSGYHGTPGPPGNHGGDIWVFKIDKTGNLLWQKCLGGTYREWARNIFPTTNGGYMIVGTTRSDDGDVVGYHAPQGLPGYADDVWFVKIDSTGNPTWQYCYGGTGDEFLYRGVIQKSDWDYVLAIGTETTEWRCYFGSQMKPDVRVAELYDSTVGIKEVRPVEEDLITVYPNPSKGIISLKFANKEFLNNASVSIFDINGKLMLMMKPKSLITTINSTKFKSGLYFIKARSKYGVITKKIIIR